VNFKPVDDVEHCRQRVRPFAEVLGDLLTQHLDAALAGIPEAWEDERLYHLGVAVDTLALLGRLHPTVYHADVHLRGEPWLSRVRAGA
jgi:hypothetical protein